MSTPAQEKVFGRGWAKSLTSNSAFGSQNTMSASAPTFIAPLVASKPTRLAVAVLVQSMICLNPTPVWFFWLSVHKRLRPKPKALMPPQADITSPSSSFFKPATHGLWSDTTKSMVPSRRASQSNLRFAVSLMGGQHLNSGFPFGISSDDKHR